MLKRIALTAMVALLAACAGDSTGPEADDDTPSPSGTYSLQSVNGSPLPAVIPTADTNLTVTSGTLTLEDEGRFTHVIEFDGMPDLVGTGDWTLDQGVVTLEYDQEGFDTESGDFNDDRITISGNLTLVYKR